MLPVLVGATGHESCSHCRLADVRCSVNFQHAVCASCRDKILHTMCQRFTGSIQPDNVLYLYVYLDMSLSNFPDHPDDG
jgi:hypothetical protein